MNFITYLVSEFLSRSIPFASIFLVAYFIDVSNFGVLTLYVVSYEILLIVISNNINAVNKIYFFQDKDSYVDKTKYQLRQSLIVASVCLLIVGLLINSNTVFMILIVSGFLKCIPQIALSYLQCKEEALSYAIVNFLYVLSFNVIFLTSVYINNDASFWAYSILIATIIQFILSIKFLPFNFFDSLKNLNSPIFSKLVYADGLMLMPQAIGFWLKIGIDRIIVKNTHTDFEVGLVGFLFQLTLPIIILANVINLYETPKVNQLISSNDKLEIIRRLYKNIFLLLISSLAIYFISILIINLYFGKYTLATTYLSISVISTFLYASFLIVTNTFYYIEMKFFISKMVFFSTIIQVIISIIANYFYGIYGLFISSSFINLLILMVSFMILKKKLQHN